MPTSTTARRHHRLVLSSCLALSVMTGCLSPSVPSERSVKLGRNGDPTQAGVGGVPAATGGSSAPAASTSSNTNVANGAGDSLGTLARIDPSKFLLGRVLVPPGILSNNGGSVIGQNGANIVSNNGGNVIGQNGANIVSNNGGNVIGQNGANVIGQNGANVIGQNGANVIGQNGANVIGQNGANVIGQNGANVIGQNGANIISNNGGSFSLGQRPLAFASIKVVDAAGKVRVNAQGAELVGQADAQGQFLLPRDSVPANSILVVSSPAISGEMAAFVPGRGAPEALDVDIVSTLTTKYVLSEYVGDEQVVLDRLTADIEQEARQDVLKAVEERGDLLPATLDATAVKGSLETLFDEDADVDDVFDRIERLLVILGITNDGDGLPATEVPLARIDGLLATASGQFIFISQEHKLLLIDSGGTIRSLVEPEAWPYKAIKRKSLGHVGMAYRAGWLYLSDSSNHRIVRIKNGLVEVLAGTGEPGETADGALARDSRIDYPSGLALSPDGTVYFSDGNNQLVRRITQDGRLETIVGGGGLIDALTGTPAKNIKLAQPRGIAFDRAGNLYIADHFNDRIRKFHSSSGLVSDITKAGQTLTPQAVVPAGDRLFAAKNSGLVEIKDGAEIPFELPLVPDSSSPSSGDNWSDFNLRTAAYANGGLYVQDDDNRVFEIKFSGELSARAIAGVSPLNNAIQTDKISSGEQLEYGSSMAMNEAGDIVISDNFRIYLKKQGQPMTLLAGGPLGGYTASSNDARKVKIPAVSTVEWDSPDSVIFCGYSRAFGTGTGTSFPAVQRVWVDSRLESIAGNGTPSLEIRVGIATDASLLAPEAILRLRDGRLLIFNDGGRIDEVSSSGEIKIYPDWPPGQEPANPSYVGTKILYLERVEQFVGLLEGNSYTRVAEFAKLASIFNDLRKFSDIRDVAMDLEGRLFVATDRQIIQVNTKSDSTRLLAGVGGFILDGDTADTSLNDVNDIDIAPNGDLLVLEYKQVKRIPQSVLRSLP